MDPRFMQDRKAMQVDGWERGRKDSVSTQGIFYSSSFHDYYLRASVYKVAESKSIC